MKQNLRTLGPAAFLVLAMSWGQPAMAQKQGGTLKVAHFDSPPSMSILEESTVAANRPMMGVFNNLVIFDQQVPQNSPKSIVPDLAKSWAWNEEGTELTMPLRQGVKWHDGQPFTARDVICTWDLLTGKSAEKLRINPRKSWYDNLEKVTANGGFEVTFHLKRAQPSFLSLLASGWSPVYPCHVTPQANALASDRNRPLQVRRIPAEPIDHGDPKSGLLEAGASLSRRDRMGHHQRHVDPDPCFYRRQRRSDLWRDDAGIEAGQERRAAVDLQRSHRERQSQPDRQPGQAALRQRRYPAGDVADARPQGVHRHPLRGQGLFRRSDGAAARWPMGNAARDAAGAAGLRAGYRKEPRRGPQP